jgi:hypothetical protein
MVLQNAKAKCNVEGIKFVTAKVSAEVVKEIEW